MDVRKIKNKELIVFDLDGTLVESKSPLQTSMSQLLVKLLEKKKVAIIGGGKYETFQDLFIKKLKCPPELLKNLFLFPTTSTVFYRYNRGWRKVYAHNLTSAEVKKIKSTFENVFREISYKHPKKTYGDIIENRGSQVSFSVYGQDIVKALGARGVAMKKSWLKKNRALKMKMAKLVAKELPDLEVKTAGYTTIDITKKGIDKAYGIRQIQKNLKIPVSKMFFVGDAIFPGGNDYAALKTGIEYHAVKTPKDTARLITKMVEAF